MKIPPLYAQRWMRAERPAYLLCETIMEKWAEAGHPNVKAWVDYEEIRVRNPETGHLTVGKREKIRSNLVNGMPPRTGTQAAISTKAS